MSDLKEKTISHKLCTQKCHQGVHYYFCNQRVLPHNKNQEFYKMRDNGNKERKDIRKKKS
jgi:YHS domain-containing protein